MHTGAADAADFLFLQHTQKLGLQSDRNFSNLIQKNGSPVCQLKQTDLTAFGRARESACLIPEQFAFQQIFRECGTV